MASWIEAITGSLEQKKQYRLAQKRINGLPAGYRDAAMSCQRYLLYSGGLIEGDTIITMMTDFADLWERAATDGTPIRDIVGEDPAEFVEQFVHAYGGKQWIDKERARLEQAIRDAEHRS